MIILNRIIMSLKKHKMILLIVLVVVVLCVVYFVFFRKGSKKTRYSNVSKSATINLQKMNLVDSVSATGSIESGKKKIVSASVENVKVKKVLVSEGDVVKKGQALIRFDKTDLQEAYNDAKDSYSDTLKQSEREVKNAYTKLSQAKKSYLSAKKNLKSQKKGTEKNTMSKDDVLQKKQSIQTAENELNAAKISREKNNKEALKSVKSSKEALDQCAAVAPFSGTVTGMGVSEGDTYSGGDLIEISDLSNLVIETSVTEYDINKVKKGQQAVIITEATGDEELKGKVSYVALTTEGSSLSASSTNKAGSSETNSNSSSVTTDGNYAVRIKIKSKIDKLRVGMTGRCSLVIKEVKNVFAVPYDAIVQNSNKKDIIRVMENGQTKEIEVKRGMESDYYTQIEADELREGMKVLIPTSVDENSTENEEGQNSKENDSLLGDFVGKPDENNFSQEMRGRQNANNEAPPGI